MEIINKFWDYIRFKRNPKGLSTNLKLMHGINRISLVMFAIAMVILALRLFV